MSPKSGDLATEKTCSLRKMAKHDVEQLGVAAKDEDPGATFAMERARGGGAATEEGLRPPR